MSTSLFTANEMTMAPTRPTWLQLSIGLSLLILRCRVLLSVGVAINAVETTQSLVTDLRQLQHTPDPLAAGWHDTV